MTIKQRIKTLINGRLQGERIIVATDDNAVWWCFLSDMRSNYELSDFAPEYVLDKEIITTRFYIKDGVKVINMLYK